MMQERQERNDTMRVGITSTYDAIERLDMVILVYQGVVRDLRDMCKAASKKEQLSLMKTGDGDGI